MSFPEDLKGATISHGSLTSGTLLCKFIDILEEIEPTRALQYRLDFQQYTGFPIHEEVEETEEVSIMLHELFDVLDELAPDGYMFGATEGDGTCFGFWESIDDWPTCNLEDYTA